MQQGFGASSLWARSIATWIFPEGYLGVYGLGVTLGLIVSGCYLGVIVGST